MTNLTPATIINGFKSTAIWPVDRTVYDCHFQSIPIQAQQDDQPSENSVAENEDCDKEVNSSIVTLPEDILPVPNMTYKNSTKSKRASNPAGKTAIVTSSPYLKELPLSEENKMLREET